MKTVTITQAMERHAGISRRQFQNMILHGELKARKVGNQWIIPITELDRVFLPR